MTIIQVEVRRKSFGETRVTERSTPALADGEVLARIDKFALTANNVSYALSGDMIGYWKFFPVEEPWGIVPVWGFADGCWQANANLSPVWPPTARPSGEGPCCRSHSSGTVFRRT